MQVISWEEYTDPHYPLLTAAMPHPHCGDAAPPLAVTVGVFDGVHRGHQALIQRICSLNPRRAQPPKGGLPSSDTVDSSCAGTGLIYPSTPLNGALYWFPTVITFRQNPLSVLNPSAYTGDILTLEQKLAVLAFLGVQLTVLIDFSGDFSTINGRDFIDLLLGCRPVKLIALGRNFRCGHQLDTGAEEIRGLAGARGVEVWVAPPVMDEGQPVSSSRIRQALADGRQAEAERLINRPIGLII